LTGQTVLVAPGRAARPMTLPDSESKHRPPRHRQSEHHFCPFCPGSEWDTPAESLAVRDPGSPADGPGWQLRVVPNKYPAISGEVGVHDVVIPCPEHEANPARLSPTAFRRMVRAWRDRSAIIAADPRIGHVTVFQNVGAEAGASLEHAHAQIVATAFVPDAIVREADGLAAYRGQSGRCFFCETPGEPVAGRDGMTVLCPNVPRFDYETWIVPNDHAARFERIADDDCDRLADLLQATLVAIDRTLHEPAYNLYVHTAPARGEVDFHWHLEIVPRTARAAGYEWGAGVFIVTVDPAVAAGRMREHFPSGGHDFNVPEVKKAR
jgi:UDPglucose--hexose-1-phosphate uridylyltransferase